MLARAVLTLTDDTAAIQKIQAKVLDGEVLDIDRMQNYGLSSNPHPGAECFVAFRGGSRSDGIAIAVDDSRYRLKNLETGEVAIYDDLGNSIILGREKISIHGVSEISLDAAKITMNGIDLMQHIHPETGSMTGKMQ